MKIKFLTLLAVGALLTGLVHPFLVRMVRGATTDTVSATVTAIVYSVDVTDGSISFGSVAQNSTKDTTTSGVDDSQTATNNGSVTEKLNIKAGNTTDWTLGSTAGNETYTLKFCTSNCDSSPTWNSVGIDPSYEVLAASLAKDDSQVFDLQVGTPTSTTATSEQTITVTVQAVAP